MCLAVFIASDHPLPERAWSEESPGLGVTPLPERDAPVRGQFARAHVYSVRAHSGCGCGFSPEQEWNETARRDSVTALVAYLTDVGRTGPVDLFVCWSDAADLEAEPKRRLRLAPAELGERSDWTAELTFVEIRSPAP
jgi:hypothetical protein